MAGTTASQGIPYAERPDPFELTADLKGSFNKIDSVFAQTRGESTMALSQSEQALVEALRAVQRAELIEDPIHVGPTEPTDGERLWVDTDEDAPPSGGGEVTSEDITDATDLGRTLLTSQWSTDARNALSIFTGTRALLDAGTDTAERTWDAKELHEYVTETAEGAGGAASWDDLTGKPATFPPATHAHAVGDVTGLADRLAALEYDTGVINLNSQITGYISGDMTIQRIGKRVEFTCYELRLTPTSGTTWTAGGFIPHEYRFSAPSYKYFSSFARTSSHNNGNARFDRYGGISLYDMDLICNLTATWFIS